MAKAAWRVRMRIHQVERQEEGPEVREVAHLVAVDDGSKVETDWTKAGGHPWASLSLQVTNPGAFGELVKGRLVEVLVQQLDQVEVTVKPDPCAMNGVAKAPGAGA